MRKMVRVVTTGTETFHRHAGLCAVMTGLPSSMNLVLFIRLCILPVLLLSLVTGLLAQNDEAGELVSGQNKKRFFTCLYWEGLPKERLYYRLGEEFLPIKFEDSRRSQNYALKGLTSFELYRDAIEPKEDQPPYDLLSKTAVPSGSSQILFLVIPFQENGDGHVKYRVVAMDDSLSAFPRGTFRFANFTSQKLLVKFAGEIEELPARKMTVMSCKPGKAGGFRPFLIGDAKGKQIFGTKLFGQPSGRELVFISPPLRRESNTPRVKFISQLIGKPRAEAGQ